MTFSSVRTIVLQLAASSCQLIVGSLCAAADEASINEVALKLLKAVEAARLDIESGELEVVLAYRRGPVMNSARYAVLFDGERRRFIKKKEGKNQPTSAFDGTEMFHYDGDNSATICDLSNADTEYLFDPRTIGIMSNYSKTSSIADCLGLNDPKSVELVDRDDTISPPVCRVRVHDKFDQTLDFWIEDAEGHRVLRSEFQTPGGTSRKVSVSTYEKESDRLPSKVATDFFSNGSPNPNGGRNLTVVASKDEVVVTDETFRLPGLGMQIGTPVADLRTKMRIGYWNGQGLQIDLPKGR